jgi:hypothetical protein
MKDELAKIRAWAQAKIDAGQEPPWAWKTYKDLIEVVDEILAGQAATITLEDSLRLQDQSECVPPLSGNIVRIDSARRRSAPQRIRLPM